MKAVGMDLTLASSFLQVTRRNVIRNVNFSSAALVGPGVSITNVQEAIVEDNVIKTAPPPEARPRSFTTQPAFPT